jgi:phosphoserine phosphatase RsbU/P
MRILIAEDDDISRILLEAILRKWGYEVVVTSDGTQAWNVLQTADAPPLAILDWMMPGLDGIEICRKVRARQTGSYTYLIILSAKGTKEAVVMGLEAGADDYLDKPFNHGELQARIKVGERIIALEQGLTRKIMEQQALAKESC